MATALLALLCLFQADEKAAAEEAVKRFNKSFANPSPSARASAVLELGQTRHEKTLNRILPLLTGDVADVRQAAARALADFGDWKKIVTPSKPAARALAEWRAVVAVIGAKNGRKGP